MSRESVNHRAVAQGRRIAATYRRAGYPDAEVEPAYCIDELDANGVYTFTVCVRVGDRNETNIPDVIRRAFNRAVGRAN